MNVKIWTGSSFTIVFLGVLFMCLLHPLIDIVQVVSTSRIWNNLFKQQKDTKDVS